jgi:hypothetical protein
MQHADIPEPPGYADLSKADKVRYLQDLWDQLSELPDDLPVLDSHLAFAEEQLAEYRRNPAIAVPAYEALDQLARKRR